MLQKPRLTAGLLCYTVTMEKIILTGIFVLLTVSFAWGGVSLYRRAQKRGERAGCACLLCFLASFACGVLVAKQFPMETIGALFAAVGGFAFWKEYRFFKRAIIVHGIITGGSERISQKMSRSNGFASNGTILHYEYAPVVQFEFDGKMRQVTGTTYSSVKPEIGKPMKVGIDPQNINDARVYQTSGLVLTAVMAVLGIVLLIIAVHSHIAGM